MATSPLATWYHNATAAFTVLNDIDGNLSGGHEKFRAGLVGLGRMWRARRDRNGRGRLGRAWHGPARPGIDLYFRFD